MFAIVEQKLSSRMPVNDFLIKASTFGKVIKLMPTEIANGTNWIHFKTETGVEISCRTFQDAYPKFANHFELDGIEFTFPKNIKSILEQAGTFSTNMGGIDDTVTLQLKKNKLYIKSKSEHGWFEAKEKIVFDQEELEFLIAPALLLVILSNEHTAEIDNEAGKLLFKGKNWRYLAMLKKSQN